MEDKGTIQPVPVSPRSIRFTLFSILATIFEIKGILEHAGGLIVVIN